MMNSAVFRTRRPRSKTSNTETLWSRKGFDVQKNDSSESGLIDDEKRSRRGGSENVIG